jgi:hypothetical protein
VIFGACDRVRGTRIDLKVESPQDLELGRSQSRPDEETQKVKFSYKCTLPSCDDADATCIVQSAPFVTAVSSKPLLYSLVDTTSVHQLGSVPRSTCRILPESVALGPTQRLGDVDSRVT